MGWVLPHRKSGRRNRQKNLIYTQACIPVSIIKDCWLSAIHTSEGGSGGIPLYLTNLVAATPSFHPFSIIQSTQLVYKASAWISTDTHTAWRRNLQFLAVYCQPWLCSECGQPQIQATGGSPWLDLPASRLGQHRQSTATATLFEIADRGFLGFPFLFGALLGCCLGAKKKTILIIPSWAPSTHHHPPPPTIDQSHSRQASIPYIITKSPPPE